MTTTGSPAAPVAWAWPRFGYGVVLAVPAAIVTVLEPQLGLGMAVGMLPAAAAGLPGRRRARRVGFVMSVVAAASLTIGAGIGQVAWLAVIGLFVLGVGAALAAARFPAGRLGLLIAFPLTGLGLSFEPSEALLVSAASRPARSNGDRSDPGQQSYLVLC